MTRRLILLSVLLGLNCTRVEQKVANKTLIEVNGEAVTAQIFARRLALRLRNRDPLTLKDSSRFDAEKQALAEELITELLCKQWAREQAIELGEAEVDQSMKMIREQYSSEVGFRQILAEENLDVEGWREITRANLYRKTAFDKLTAEVAQPTESELKTLFEANRKELVRPARIKVRQIVVEKEDTAQRLFAEVQSGKPIGPLAREYSITAESEADGVTDWIEKGALPVFDEAFKLAVGSPPKLLKSPYGWHVVEVIAKEPERKLKFEDLKSQILRVELERRRNQKFTQWLDSRLRQATILRHEAALKSVSISTRDD